MKEIDVLLVEDNPHDVFLVKTALADQAIPHRLRVIEDGKAAIDFAKTIGTMNGAPCPDLLLLDINLPKVSGLEVLRYFRGHLACRHLPVIVISSSGAPKERERMLEFQATRFFKKPIELDEFMQLGTVVREVVERSTTGLSTL